MALWLCAFIIYLLIRWQGWCKEKRVKLAKMVERSPFAKATRDLLEDDLMLKLTSKTLLFFRRQHRIVEVSRERFLSVLFSAFIVF